MNIKRAFLAAAAVLMVPGFAMAQDTATFDTSISYTNGDTGSVNVELVCNAGNPLSQDFDIAPGAGVMFTVANLDLTSTTLECTIGLSGLDAAYTATGCTFNAAGTPVAASNTCAITAMPSASNFELKVMFDGVTDPSIDQGYDAKIECTNAAWHSDSTTFGTITTSYSDSGNGIGGIKFFPSPASTTGSACTATLSNTASAIEDNGPCSVTYNLGDATGGCTITATAFFEGIPTLSQYGMAIMVLLMLGVGFVGFRRFV